jgi:phospholipase C
MRGTEALQAAGRWYRASRMLVIVTYEENGGFWDHVRPPVGPGWGDRWGPARAFRR